jgi:hypothetical protein
VYGNVWIVLNASLRVSELRLFFVSSRRESHEFTATPKSGRTKKSNNANKEALKHNPHLSEIPSLFSIFEEIQEKRKLPEYYRPPAPTELSKS